MSATAIHKETFRQGSKTYYNSSVFFPESVREDVFILYGFVRVADNYVDSVPQDVDGFNAFVADYRRARGGRHVANEIIDPFVDLMSRKDFKSEWVDAFLHSMEMDIYKSTYETMNETLEYIYGSAEVIGLFMARILELPDDSLPFAEMQGRAMQYINFIRDVAEDVGLGRRYLPLAGSDLDALDSETARTKTASFERFIRKQIETYYSWQQEARKGYRYIPRRYLIPIKTASDMYGWTADCIYRDPHVIFERKVKPPKPRILLQVLRNSLVPRRNGS